MTLKLKPSPSPPASPFTWDLEPSSPPAFDPSERAPSPPTSWLSAPDMKTFGASPLSQDIGIVKCKDCSKPILRSAFQEHTDNCNKIRGGGKKGGAKSKAADVEEKKGKKRKAEDEVPNPDDPSAPKAKKPARGRAKGPVDYDKQCGVINDKGLPCSRSLTCKSHSMGAKRSVQGRSKPYDELLLEWNRAHNPNWVEPVKKESKAERKERKEREKAEKKRLAMEAAAADASKKGPSAAPGGAAKKGKKATAAAAAAAAAVSVAAHVGSTDDVYENLDDVDSEQELDTLVRAVRAAHNRGVIGTPLAVPCDTSSWFIARRERLRTCNQLLANALMPSRNASVPVVGRLT